MPGGDPVRTSTALFALLKMQCLLLFDAQSLASFESKLGSRGTTKLKAPRPVPLQCMSAEPHAILKHTLWTYLKVFSRHTSPARLQLKPELSWPSLVVFQLRYIFRTVLGSQPSWLKSLEQSNT